MDLQPRNLWQKAFIFFKRVKSSRDFFLLLSFALTSCDFRQGTGSLLVKADHPGTFEVFKISQLEPLQLESEMIGVFNEELSLKVGSYLILADCSFANIVVHRQNTKVIHAFKIKFIPPAVEITDQDRFPVQCSRFEPTRSRQSSETKFEFSVLEGQWEMLVGMYPLSLDLNPNSLSSEVAFKLGAVRVEAQNDGGLKDYRYFISPINQRASVTFSQQFNGWTFLPEGSYQLELHGTKLAIELKSQEFRSVPVSRIRVNVPKGVDLKRFEAVRGIPALYEVNTGHWLGLNDDYPILPGEIKLKLPGSTKQTTLVLNEGEKLEKTLYAVQVDQACEAQDYSCLGAKKIQLFDDGEFYPFSEGTTDAPVFFLQDSVWLGVEGGRDIRAKIIGKKELQKLKTSTLVVKPEVQKRNAYQTDFMRVVPTNGTLSGKSMDLSLDKESKISLLEGYYSLELFSSSVTNDSERNRSKIDFYVHFGKETVLRPTVFELERKNISARKQEKNVPESNKF